MLRRTNAVLENKDSIQVGMEHVRHIVSWQNQSCIGGCINGFETNSFPGNLFGSESGQCSNLLHNVDRQKTYAGGGRRGGTRKVEKAPGSDRSGTRNTRVRFHLASIFAFLLFSSV